MWEFSTFTINMKQEIKTLFPKWVNDEEKGKYVLALTDDIDSLFSSALLKKIKEYEINYFYDFKNLYILDEKNKKRAIGVDLSLTKGKCFDNHVTMFTHTDKYNIDSANINNILKISRENYFQKYAMGTHLTILSYYNVLDLSILTDEQKLVLWAIDSSYLGHYSKYENDRKSHEKYIKLLELEEMADVLERYKQKDFREIINEYQLHKKIIINEKGILETSIDVEKIQRLFSCLHIQLPSEPFSIKTKLSKSTGLKLKPNQKYTTKNIQNKIFSFALTRKNFVNLTMI